MCIIPLSRKWFGFAARKSGKAPQLHVAGDVDSLINERTQGTTLS